MILLRAAAIALLLAGLATGHGRAADAVADRCQTAADLVTAQAPLPLLAAAVAARKLDILVIGSATVFGPEASLHPGSVTRQSMTGIRSEPPPPSAVPGGPTTASFPIQMANALREAVPGLAVDITIRGGRGMAASEMLELMRQELPKKPYQLVIWQTGTIEAVRNIPPGEFYETLAAGVALAQDAKADLVLVDQQYSRFLQSNTNLDPYAQSMQQVAALPGAVLFHRLEIMRSWANDGQIDLEHTPKGQRRATVALLHACLGRQLAKFLLGAAVQ